MVGLTGRRSRRWEVSSYGAVGGRVSSLTPAPGGGAVDLHFGGHKTRTAGPILTNESLY